MSRAGGEATPSVRVGRRIAFVAAAVVLATTAVIIAIWPSPSEQFQAEVERMREAYVQAGIPADRLESRLDAAIEARRRAHTPLHDFRVRLLPTIAGALLAVAGAARHRPLLLVVGFFVGFFPFWIGLYFLFVGWYPALIGLGELAYLVAAVLIRRGSRAAAAAEL